MCGLRAQPSRHILGQVCVRFQKDVGMVGFRVWCECAYLWEAQGMS